MRETSCDSLQMQMLPDGRDNYMDKFQLHSDYQPMGDQPEAINTLVEGIENGTCFGTSEGVVDIMQITESGCTETCNKRVCIGSFIDKLIYFKYIWRRL